MKWNIHHSFISFLSKSKEGLSSFSKTFSPLHNPLGHWQNLSAIIAKYRDVLIGFPKGNCLLETSWEIKPEKMKQFLFSWWMSLEYHFWPAKREAHKKAKVQRPDIYRIHLQKIRECQPMTVNGIKAEGTTFDCPKSTKHAAGI